MLGAKLPRDLPGGLAYDFQQSGEANWPISSASISARVFPAVRAIALRAASMTCRSRMTSSRRDILVLGLGQDPIPEVPAQEASGVQIHLPAQDPREFRLHREEREAGNVPVLELHEDVHVAPGREIVPEDRAKQSQTAHVIALAELGDASRVDGNAGSHG